MRVTLETHGGFAAGIQRSPERLETASLDESSAGELARLVQRAIAEAPPVSRSHSVPDAMSYTISIEDEGTAQVLRQSDSSMSGPFAELLDWLGRHFSGR